MKGEILGSWKELFIPTREILQAKNRMDLPVDAYLVELLSDKNIRTFVVLLFPW